MKPIFLVFLTLSLVVHASFINHDYHLTTRRDHHSQLHARRANLSSSSLSRRCKPRARPDKKVYPGSSPSSDAAPAAAPTPSNAAATFVNNSPNDVPVISGLLNVQSGCGPSGATAETTATSGPNGSEDWLNCGLFDGAGWSPPYVTIDQIIAEDLDQAISSDGSPFQKCSDYVYLFKKYAYEHGLPPIMIASFALQESSCNPNTVGGAGEQGLMQLTKDKCGDAPNGNCKDPEYNVKTGAKFFADTLASNGGDVLLSIGQYNGWSKGLTYAGATAQAFGLCCRCQNNLDYLQQFMNGWLQNKNVYGGTPRIGKYFNLDVCI